MIRHARIVLALISLLCPALLTAQTVVTAPPPLDAVHARVRDAVQTLEDSLRTVTAAAARVQRDLNKASSALLHSRAREMRDGCQRSAMSVAPTSAVITEAGLPSPDPKHQGAKILEALHQLEESLENCVTEFDSLAAPTQAATMKGYGTNRAVKVNQVVARYESALQAYLGAVNIRLGLRATARK